MVGAVEGGYPQREIARSAYEHERAIQSGERVIVGVNRYQSATESRIPTLSIDPSVEREQVARLARVKAERSAEDVQRALSAVRSTAQGDGNLMPPIIAAARAYCSEQEICDVLRAVFGSHSDRAEF
jgi:methylmalonyl-CoA mutase N-terminal domain/subunit